MAKTRAIVITVIVITISTHYWYLALLLLLINNKITTVKINCENDKKAIMITNKKVKVTNNKDYSNSNK